MPNHETPAKRYRRLARECLDTANAVPPRHRDVVIQRATVWLRLAKQHEERATPPFRPSAGEQPVMQQQQQVQPKDDDKKE
jgi:hypothetical protein